MNPRKPTTPGSFLEHGRITYLAPSRSIRYSPYLGITSRFLWTMAPNLGADRVRVVYGTDVRLEKGKSAGEAHNAA